MMRKEVVDKHGFNLNRSSSAVVKYHLGCNAIILLWKSKDQQIVP